MEVPNLAHIDIEQADQVFVIRIRRTPRQADQAGGPPPDRHAELATVFERLRADEGTRVVVVTGSEPGTFVAPPPASALSDPTTQRTWNDPGRLWTTFNGILRCHEAMASLDKPVVAKVNGNAIGFGSSLMFGCDLIVAREDAVISDTHLGMSDVNGYGPAYGLVPGDGGVALVPMHMTPTQAKEYLMLPRAYTALELRDRGIVNYAVPLEDLDAVVDGLVQRLLRRSAHALAWTKRVVNRRTVEHLNLTLDAGAAYEMVNLYQLERADGNDHFKLG